MSAPPGGTARPTGDIIAFVEALARAQVKRDIAALRAASQDGEQGGTGAHGHLRTLQQ